MTTSDTYHIIESAEQLPFLIRVRDVLLTLFVWGLYLYYMDVFFFGRTVVAWVVHDFDRNYMASLGDIRNLAIYLPIALLTGGALIGWSVYNQLRYGPKKARRASSPPVAIEHVASLYNVSTADINSWRSAKALIMHHASNGQLIKVEAQDSFSRRKKQGQAAHKRGAKRAPRKYFARVSAK